MYMGVQRTMETCTEMYNFVHGGTEDHGDLHRDVDAPKPPLRPNGQPRAEGTRLGNERVKG